jgi:ribonuclease P protein component
MIVYEAPGGDPSRARLGLAVSRSVGCAVLRNRVKRRIREAFRLNAGGFKPGTDLLVVARAESATASAAEVARELLSLHTRLAGGR